MSYVVAGVFALLVAAIEQATELGGGPLPWRNGAWRWWAARVGVEVGAVLVVLGVAQSVGVEHAEDWWAGALVALGTVGGLRSSFIDIGDHTYGFREGFDRARAFFTRRLQQCVRSESAKEAVRDASLLVDEVMPAVRASGLELEKIGARLETVIQLNKSFSVARRAEEISAVRKIARDDATSTEERLRSLLLLAFELGGAELLDQIKADAAASSRQGN